MTVTINNKTYNNVFEIGTNGYGQIYFYYYNKTGVAQIKVIKDSDENTGITMTTSPRGNNHE